MHCDEFNRRYIGSSDVASLILAGHRKNHGVCAEVLSFGEDGSYVAYVVDGKAKIGDRYQLKAEFDDWMSVYDDAGKTAEFTAEKILVYRDNEFGFIIQCLKAGDLMEGSCYGKEKEEGRARP